MPYGIESRYFSRIHSFERSSSSSSASFASRILRVYVRSLYISSERTSCIVIVDPPWTVLRDVTFLIAARATPS